MTLNSICLLDLANPQCARSWFWVFSTLARAEGWKDTDAIAETDDISASAAHYCITDNFQARLIGEIKFKDITTYRKAYLKPK